ncbi:MAG: DUF5666 domain-containing protein [Terriglobia bacterium]
MRRFGLSSVLACLLAVTFVACQSSPPPSLLAGTGTVYVTVSDAPLASVLAFQVTLTGLTLSDGTNMVSVLSEPTSVEFGRLLGLRTLLGLSSLPGGTYTSAILTLATPVISFLDLSTSPASVGILEGSLTRSSLTVALDPALIVSEGGLAGLHLHFRLRDSLEVDALGELTGMVDPHIGLRAIPPGAEESFIEELRGGVSSVNVAGNSFTLQTLRGRLLTVHVNDETLWEEGESLSTLAPPAVVEISGRVRADRSLLAASVEVLSRERLLLGGLVLNPEPAMGPAERVTLLVREEIPDLTGIEVGRTATLEFEERTRFDIHNIELPLEFLLFNRAALVRGQRVALGGALDTSTTPASFTIRRVVLHRQGVQGGRVPGSVRIVSGNTGGFRLRTGGLFGLLFDASLQVVTFERTRFVNLAGLTALQGSEPMRLRIVGLVLRRSDTGEPLLVAGRIERVLPPTP